MQTALHLQESAKLIYIATSYPVYVLSYKLFCVHVRTLEVAR